MFSAKNAFFKSFQWHTLPSALVVAFVASADGSADGLGRVGYAAACCAFYKAAAAHAKQTADGSPVGPGTFKSRLLDALAMEPAAIAAAVGAGGVSVTFVRTPDYQST